MADEIGVVLTKQKFNVHMEADAELSQQVQQIQQGIQQRISARIRNNADALDLEMGTAPQQWRYEGPEFGSSTVRRFIRNDVRDKVAKDDAEKIKDQLGRENEVKPPSKAKRRGELAAAAATPTAENGSGSAEAAKTAKPVQLPRRERRARPTHKEA